MSELICRNCKFFKPNTKNYYSKYYALKYGYCTEKNSTFVNNVTGEVSYHFAKDMRDMYNCGKKGQFYVENPNKISKFVAEISYEDITTIFIYFVFASLFLFSTNHPQTTFFNKPPAMKC